MENKSLKDRIIEVMHGAVSRQAFCNIIGIDPTALHRIFKEKESVPILILQKICRAYPNINTRWLLLGEGEFLIPQARVWLDKFKITIRVADESFKLTIIRDNEEFYRRAAQKLKDKLNAISYMYPEISLERKLKIIAIKSAVDIEKRNSTAKQNAEKDILEISLNDNPILKAAYANLKGEYDVYSQKYPTYSLAKVLAIVSYHFECKNIN